MTADLSDNALDMAPGAAGCDSLTGFEVPPNYQLMKDLLAGNVEAAAASDFPVRVSELVTCLVTDSSAKDSKAAELLWETDEKIAALELKLKKRDSRIADLLRELYGSRSERMTGLDSKEEDCDDSDDSDADEQAAAGPIDYVSDGKVKGEKHATGSRRIKFPAFLAREEVREEYEHDSCQNCGCTEFYRMPDDRSESLAEREVQNYVIVNVSSQRKCRNCNEVMHTKHRKTVYSRRFLDPSLVSRVAVESVVKGTSINRLAKDFEYRRIPISTELLNKHFISTGELLQPLCDYQKQEVLQALRLIVDDTRLPLNLKPDDGREPKDGLTLGHAWFYLRDDRAFGGAGPVILCIEATEDWKSSHPKEFLAGFEGVIQGDAYPGWKSLCAESAGMVVLMCCWAHARRRFVNGLKKKRAFTRSERRIAELVLGIIKKIFRIERKIYGKSPADRLAVRQQETAPLVGELHRILTEERPRLEEGSELAPCIDYMLNSWDYFTVFLDCGFVCLTTNLVEGVIRKYGVGRLNWGHRNSMRGAKAHANLNSLILTCILNNINPYEWLRDVLMRWLDTPDDEKWKLVPYHWIKHFGGGKPDPSGPDDGNGGGRTTAETANDNCRPVVADASAACRFPHGKADLAAAGQEQTRSDSQAADKPLESQTQATTDAGIDMAAVNGVDGRTGVLVNDGNPPADGKQDGSAETERRNDCRNGPKQSDSEPVPAAKDEEHLPPNSQSAEADAGNGIKIEFSTLPGWNVSASVLSALPTTVSIEMPSMNRVPVSADPMPKSAGHSMLQNTGPTNSRKFTNAGFKTSADFSKLDYELAENTRKLLRISSKRDPPELTEQQMPTHKLAGQLQKLQ